MKFRRTAPVALLAMALVACTFPKDIVERDAGSDAPIEDAACRFPDGSLPPSVDGSPVPREVGAHCDAPADCASRMCDTARFCTAHCVHRCDCPGSSSWSCRLLAGVGNVCSCENTGREVCDGIDNDCDGLVDDGIDCNVRSCADDPTERGCGLVGVNGGTFAMGSSSVRIYEASPIQPVIHVDGFSMDAYEVTVARFRRFWIGANHPAPTTRIAYPGNQTIEYVGLPRRPAVLPRFRCNWSDAPAIPGREFEPIDCVDWQTALAFCVWDGGRLPTDAEWEYAARGRAVDDLSTGRNFPWGADEPTGGQFTECDRAQLLNCAAEKRSEPGTRLVGSFAGSGGFFDLAGNVWEWTADFHMPYSDAPCWGGIERSNPLCYDEAVTRMAVQHVLRGGGFYNAVDSSFSATRNLCCGAADGLQSFAPGFRCAR